MTKGRDHTYHKHCPQFLYKHNPHSPMRFPRSSAQSNMEYPLRQTAYISTLNYLQGNGALGVCVCVCVYCSCNHFKPLHNHSYPCVIPTKHKCTVCEIINEEKYKIFLCMNYKMSRNKH